MRVRRTAAENQLRHLSDEVVSGTVAERTNVEHRLGHGICGRDRGNRDGRPTVCWKPCGRPGAHL